MIRSADIALCAIYRNEERLLPAFLERHAPLFGELVLVDTGSTDRSVEIVKDHGQAHHYFPWTDHFSRARNRSLELAQKPWICVLDIDEVLLPQDMEQALSLLNESPTNGLSLCQINLGFEPVMDDWRETTRLPEPFRSLAPGYSVSRLIRLFCNDPRVRFQGVIHETVGESLHAAGLMTRITDIPIYHLGWALTERSPEEQMAKRSRYRAIIREAFKSEPTVQNGYYLLASQDSAGERLRIAYDLTRRFPEILDFTIMMAQCAVELGEWPRARDYIRRGLTRFPASETLRLLELKALNRCGRPEEALARLKFFDGRLSRHPDALMEQTKALILLGRVAEARKNLSEMADGQKPGLLAALEKMLDS
jgi:glycosyltransferase involved in cell wall biosynthesis